jgi:hypothetical protein
MEVDHRAKIAAAQAVLHVCAEIHLARAGGTQARPGHVPARAHQANDSALPKKSEQLSRF